MFVIDYQWKKSRPLALLTCVFLGAVVYYLVFLSFLNIPSLYRVSVGEPVFFGEGLPPQLSSRITAFVKGDGGGKLLWHEGALAAGFFYPYQQKTPIAAVPGLIDLDFRLFGIFPLKHVTLQVLPPVKVLVGGHSIGVLLNSRGVLVVGYAEVRGPDGKISCPARQAGLVPGDLILQIENTDVQSDTQVSSLIDRLARQKGVLRLRIKHQGTVCERLIKPVYCQETRRFRVGLYVRDGTAGVGTLTFVEPLSGKYGALGHVIVSSENNELLDLSDGRIVKAWIQGVHRGGRGRIGEKIGLFNSSGQIAGEIEKNTRCGIFGRMNTLLSNPLYPQPIPVALGHQVREGRARLLTVIRGDLIEAFDVDIIHVFPRPRSDGKAFVIKITDPELLRSTGGIIQGMSGSPIIQNGRLVGAVTHVFINDPTRGYGVAAEAMLEEAGLLAGKEMEATASSD